MQVLVAYYSQTGNTARIARAIHDAVVTEGHTSDLVEVQATTVAALNDYDLVILGSTCHSSDLAAPVKKLLGELAASAPFKLAGFVTHATTMPDEGSWGPEMYERWSGRCARTFQQVCEQKQIAFLGYFHCQGAPSCPISEFIHNTIIPDDDKFATYMDDVKGHPDATDLKQAREFALQILEIS